MNKEILSFAKAKKHFPPLLGRKQDEIGDFATKKKNTSLKTVRLKRI